MRPALAALALLLAPASAGAQSPPDIPLHGEVERQVTQTITTTVAGYGRAATDTEEFVLSVDPAAGRDQESRTATLYYATNRAVGSRVDIHVVADLDGLVLDVEPIDGSLVVDRVARAGAAGSPSRVTFSEPGTLPFVVGVGQVVARLGILYTVRALPGAGPSGPRTVVVTYTVSS